MLRDTVEQFSIENNGVAEGPGVGGAAVPIVLQHDFDGLAVRTMMRGGNPWFVLDGVCRALNLRPHKRSFAGHVAKLDDDERLEIGRDAMLGEFSGFKLEVGAGSNMGGRPPSAWLISESGLYTLILRSRKATTPGTLPHRFRKWVTNEVLPALRRAAQGELPTAKPGAVTLTLEAPGRYEIALEEGHQPRIERQPAPSLLRIVRATEQEALALALRTIGVWWRRNATLSSAGITVNGFAQNQLELAILNGDQLGDEYLKFIQAPVR